MTKAQEINLLEREGFVVVETTGDHVYRCKEKGVEYDSCYDFPELYVFDDGKILPVPSSFEVVEK